MKKILLLIFSLTIIYQTKALKLSSRLSKQFKDGDNEAMSLVDALQQWADALEAQISMMRAEVIEVKSSNRDLNQQVDELTSENQRLKDEVKSLNEDVDIFKLTHITSNLAASYFRTKK